MPSRRIARTQAKKAALLQAQLEEDALNGRGPPAVAPDANDDEDDELSEQFTKLAVKEIVAIPPFTDYQLATDQILHLFHRLFQANFTDTLELQSTIQAVKTDLYHREYLDAFDDDAKRLAYLIRWSSLRALSYASLMSSMTPIVEMISEYIIDEDDEFEDCQCLLIGGGASAEIVALAAIYGRMKEFCSTRDKPFQVNVMDISDWAGIVTEVTREINTLGWIRQVPEAREQQFITNYLKNDVLTYFDEAPAGANPISLANQKLITLLFTTNELFQEDKAKSIRFFQRMNDECTPGTLLFIAESAGSYSNIKIGTKEFPVFFMIDMLLSNKKSELKKAGSGKKSKQPEAYDGAWELVESSDSCWYRVDKPSQDFYSSRLQNIKLENMRFFFRLYRKL